MAEISKIQWTDSTFNAWEGCTKVGPGCDNCYAEARNGRFHAGANWGAGAPRLMRSDAYWREPVKWNANHVAFQAEHGHRQRVFCSSLADVFDNEAPEGQRERLWRLIADTPHLDWLLVTKRIGNVKRFAPSEGLPRNVWLGITVVNQEEADRDIPKLLATPAQVRFLSVEPLLDQVTIFDLDGPIDVPSGQISPLHWVIVGGESGRNARSMTLGWAKDIVRQCQSAGVPVFVKQLGAKPVNRDGVPHPISDAKGAIMDDWPLGLRVREFPR